MEEVSCPDYSALNTNKNTGSMRNNVKQGEALKAGDSVAIMLSSQSHISHASTVKAANPSIKIIATGALVDPDIEGFSNEDIEIDKESVASFALENINKNVNGGIFSGLSIRRSSRPNNTTVPNTDGVDASTSTAPPVRGNRYSTGIDYNDTNTFSGRSSSQEFRPLSTSDGQPMHVLLNKQPPGEGPKVEGREIKQDHKLYALTYGMMLGIRVMLRRIEYELREQREAMWIKAAQLGDDPSTSSSDQHLIELLPSDYTFDIELPFPPEGTIVSHSRRSINISVDNHSTGSEPARTSTPSIAPTFKLHAVDSLTKSATPAHKLNQTFKFKDYCPKAFRAIRGMAGIDEGSYMRSVAGDFNYIEFIANSKSGQFFFYSHDGKYMIKTQTKEESKLLRKMLPQYVEHIFTYPNSLLVRFYGMHRVKMAIGKSSTGILTGNTSIHFVIMSSVFDTDKPIHIKYDLKGSTVGRLTKDSDCSMGAVRKDLNLANSARKFKFSEAHAEIFKATVETDTNFLASMNIMDYSLLVGVHESANLRPVRRPSGVQLNERSAAALQNLAQQPHVAHPHGHFYGQRSPDESVFQSFHGGIRSSSEAGEIYYLGIIDILQLYNIGKRGETIFKSMLGNGSQISSVSPKFYAKRFNEFLLKHTNYYDLKERQASGLSPMQASPTSSTDSAVGSFVRAGVANNPLLGLEGRRKRSHDGNHQVLIMLPKDRSQRDHSSNSFSSPHSPTIAATASPETGKEPVILTPIVPSSSEYTENSFPCADSKQSSSHSLDGNRSSPNGTTAEYPANICRRESKGNSREARVDASLVPQSSHGLGNGSTSGKDADRSSVGTQYFSFGVNMTSSLNTDGPLIRVCEDEVDAEAKSENSNHGNLSSNSIAVPSTAQSKAETSLMKLFNIGSSK